MKIEFESDNLVFVWDEKGNHVEEIIVISIPETAMIDHEKNYKAIFVEVSGED